MTEKIEITPYDLNTMLFYAFRYALGRKTYAVEDMSQLIYKFWPMITEVNRTLIIKEIAEELRRNASEADNFKWRVWKLLLEELQGK